MQPSPQKDHPVPHRASAIGMWLFLASLAMLFIASMLGYVLMRVTRPEIQYGSIELPKELWLSTLLILASSFTIQRALAAIRREKQSLFRIYLSATLMFSGLFVCIQTPAMIELAKANRAAIAARQERVDAAATQPSFLPPPTAGMQDERINTPSLSMPFYGLVLVLILVHALHVLGGIIALGIVAYYGYRGAYDHEQHASVRNCTLYWHFLDAVWIVMFTVISAFG